MPSDHDLHSELSKHLASLHLLMESTADLRKDKRILRQLIRLQKLAEFDLKLKMGLVKAPDEPVVEAPQPPLITESPRFYESELTYKDTHPPYIYDFSSPTFDQNLCAPIKIDRPLVFVPGIMGSKLFLPRLSGPDDIIWPPITLASHNSLSLLGNQEPKRADGLFPGAYEELIHFLHSIGYRENINFWIFAYDWTRSNRISGTVLASFIVDEILGNHPEWDSVDVVNHSMGGLVTREAYRQIGDKIRRIAYLASPHFGSPKAYFVLHPEIEISFGSFFDDVLAELVWDRIFKIPGDPDDLDAAIKGLADQFQSVYELLPDEFYFEKHLIVSVDAEFPNPDRNVTKPEPTYITDVCQLPQGRHGLAQEALAFKRALGRDIPPSDEGSRLIVYSNTKVTTDRIEFDQDALDDFEDPFDSGQQGDGTVPSYSGRAGYKKAVMVGEDHCTVPNCQNTFRALRHFLAQ